MQESQTSASLALDFAPASGGRKKVQHHSTFLKK